MSKYNKLWEYIKENDIQELSFEEIEKVLGFPIDHSFLNAKKELERFGKSIEKISLKNKIIKIKNVIEREN